VTTEIEWARNADGTKGETWNPTTGCDRVSPGCDNCYAMKLAGRLKRMGQAKYQRDGDPRTSGPGFGLTLHPDALDIPLRRKKPTTWFVDSMSDLFHPGVPDGFVADVFGVMAVAGRQSGHTFQVLTKRPQRAAKLLGASVTSYRSPLSYLSPSNGHPVDYSNARTAIAACAHRWAIDRVCAGELSDGIESVYWPLPNVWLGTSIESDRYVWRADHLRDAPAAVRFVSLEPLLGPVPSLDLTGIDWVITGGESGPNARPIEVDWARDIRDRCQEAGVAFFFKQWGEWLPLRGHREHLDLPPAQREWAKVGAETMVRVGKKIAGRELDGRTWDEMPDHAGVVA
jgi:protein gp37